MAMRFGMAMLSLTAVLFSPVLIAQTELPTLVKSLNNQSMHHTPMVFADYFKRLRRVDIKQQTKLLNQLAEAVASLSSESLTQCDTVALDHVQFKLGVSKSRLQLLNRLEGSAPNYNGSFSDLQNGDLWYQHWLQSWLHSDVSIDALEAIAYSELNDVKQRRAVLERAKLPENHHSIDGDDAKSIVSQFQHREDLVYQYTQRVFGSAFSAPKVNIVKSTLPKDFPAPGIYNDLTQEFIYHLHGETLPQKHMDWLFLHEAVPGHHFFSQYSQQSVTCPEYIGADESTLFTEGWAAYVETLGSELGLFTDRTSIGYALDWQALRAVRVLLDIGIHANGWSDQQARDVWMKYIPEQRDIMQREITRIRRWPVQVITYVYGKAMIKRTIETIRSESPERQIADIHRAILSHSNFSLRSLRFLQEI